RFCANLYNLRIFKRNVIAYIQKSRPTAKIAENSSLSLAVKIDGATREISWADLQKRGRQGPQLEQAVSVWLDQPQQQDSHTVMQSKTNVSAQATKPLEDVSLERVEKE